MCKGYLLALLRPFTDPNDRFSYPFIYFNWWNPYPFIYLKPEKDTPLGGSLPVLAIVGSIPGVLMKETILKNIGTLNVHELFWMLQCNYNTSV